MFDFVVGKNVCGIFVVVVGGVVGAVSDFGGGIGVWGWIRGCHLLTRLCVCMCVWERKREAFCRQDDERGARLTGSKLDCVCCIGVDFFMPQRRKY